MKKNAMLKIAAILMVAVLLTTCAISSTFAKYTTTGDTKSDSARVAKWGVTIDTTIEGLFLDKYDAGSNDEVISADTTDVVAPGTTGSVTLNTSVKGTPEVAVEITTAATVSLDNWVGPDDKWYCPLAVTVNGATKTGNEFASADLFEDWIKAEIEKATKQYAAGTDLAAATDFDLVISWTWAYTGANGQTDVKDTYLGNAGINVGTETDPVYLNENDPAEISISITQTVTQLDSYTAPAVEG